MTVSPWLFRMLSHMRFVRRAPLNHYDPAGFVPGLDNEDCERILENRRSGAEPIPHAAILARLEELK